MALSTIKKIIMVDQSTISHSFQVQNPTNHTIAGESYISSLFSYKELFSHSTLKIHLNIAMDKTLVKIKFHQ